MKQKTALRTTIFLKWTVFALIILNVLSLITLPRWLSAIYSGGYTYLLGGGYFDEMISANIRTDYLFMLIFLGICATLSLIILILAFQILKRFCIGNAFDTKNVKDLKLIGFIILGISATGIIKLCYQFTLYSILFIAVFCLASLFFFVLSSIFEEANRIKEENDLMI